MFFVSAQIVLMPSNHLAHHQILQCWFMLFSIWHILCTSSTFNGSSNEFIGSRIWISNTITAAFVFHCLLCFLGNLKFQPSLRQTIYIFKYIESVPRLFSLKVVFFSVILLILLSVTQIFIATLFIWLIYFKWHAKQLPLALPIFFIGCIISFLGGNSECFVLEIT